MAKNAQEKTDVNVAEFGKAELGQTLVTRNFSVRYQPILLAETCQNFAYLARIKGAQESPIRNIDRLFGIAGQAGILPKLTKRYLEAVLNSFHDHGKPLLLPMPAISLNELGAEAALILTKALKKTATSAASIIVIHPGITAHAAQAIRNTEAFTRALHSAEIRHASQNFGCSLSESLLWSKYPPQLMLLDQGHLDDIDADSQQIERLRDFIAVDQARGRKVLVQDIASVEQLNLALELRFDLLTGDFISKAKAKPYDSISAAALRIITKHCPVCQIMPASGQNNLLERLLTRQSPVDPGTPAEMVYSRFETNPDLLSLAVVKDGVPLGIISRYEMVDNMSRPFRHELFGRKACERFMDSEPMIMDVQISTPDLMDQVINAHPRHLISGFIVTDSCGHYIGMGAVQDLMREITNMQIQAARYANPLTQLPGNVAINQHLDSLLARNIACVVAYCDLDHFKPFNDVYGYAKGDEMILLNAVCLNEVIDPELDFLGHVGGDDFILIFRSPDWQERCQRALTCFGQKVMTLFEPSDIAQGGYIAANRKGEMELHALASLSIGAVEAPPGLYENHLAVSTVAAEVKKQAKAIKGNSLYVNQRKPL